MVGLPGLYFVITSDHLARFVRPDPDNGLHTIETVTSAVLRGRDGLPSSTVPPFGTGPPEPEQSRFARLLAARIADDFAVDLFSHLVLVAPPHVLRNLAELLDQPTRMSLVGSLAKDLTSVPDLELWPHLLPWIHPGQVASPVVVPFRGP